jgi:hypothetical protein
VSECKHEWTKGVWLNGWFRTQVEYCVWCGMLKLESQLADKEREVERLKAIREDDRKDLLDYAASCNQTAHEQLACAESAEASLSAANIEIERLTAWNRDLYQEDVNVARARLERESRIIATAEARLAAVVEALDKLAKLGNGDSYGNSIGNCIAKEALAALTPALPAPAEYSMCAKCGSTDIERQGEVSGKPPVIDGWRRCRECGYKWGGRFA